MKIFLLESATNKKTSFVYTLKVTIEYCGINSMWYVIQEGFKSIFSMEAKITTSNSPDWVLGSVTYLGRYTDMANLDHRIGEAFLF